MNKKAKIIEDLEAPILVVTEDGKTKELKNGDDDSKHDSDD